MTRTDNIPRQDSDASRANLNELFERLYTELRVIARHYMAGERPNHTLQPTALVHEAYVRLIASGAKIENRAHFLRLAARTMRRILIDLGRKRKFTFVPLPDDAGGIFPDVDTIDFDRALDKLEKLDARQALIVELRLFIGLTVDEVAAELGVSPRTVKGDTAVALAWLRRELE